MTITTVFKLLSDETRLRVIYLLSQEQLCVCELCGILDVSQPKISKILAKLRDLELVEDHRKEKFVFYMLNHDHLLLATILNFIHEHLQDYPQIALDKERIADKETYLNTCSLKGLKELTHQSGGK